jgi:hypothetical protein
MANHLSNSLLPFIGTGAPLGAAGLPDLLGWAGDGRNSSHDEPD